MAAPPKKIADLLGQLAGLVGGVEDLVVEDGEVEGETQPDGVGGLHGRLGNVESILISLLGIVNNSSLGISYGNLGKIPVVVTLHLQVEHLGLRVTGLGDEEFV